MVGEVQRPLRWFYFRFLWTKAVPELDLGFEKNGNMFHCCCWTHCLSPLQGCDSGFGHELAKRLSEMGVMVFAGVLDVDGVGAQQLRERANENLRVLQLDVTDSSQIEAVYRYVCSQVAATGETKRAAGDANTSTSVCVWWLSLRRAAAGLWGLVNNAGILQCPMDAELQPITMCRRFMDVNFLGAVKMCQVFLPLLRRSRGRIVNVSSMAGTATKQHPAMFNTKRMCWLLLRLPLH